MGVDVIGFGNVTTWLGIRVQLPTTLALLIGATYISYVLPGSKLVYTADVVDVNAVADWTPFWTL